MTRLFTLVILSGLVGCAFSTSSSDWVSRTHRTDDYAFTLQHLRTWTVEDLRNVTIFRPPNETEEGNIALVVYNHRETPPLPVDVTYATIRVITIDDRQVLVQRRDPAPVTERYVAFLREGDWVAEFRCFLDAAVDSTFDHMVGSFTFISS